MEVLLFLPFVFFHWLLLLRANIYDLLSLPTFPLGEHFISGQEDDPILHFPSLASRPHVRGGEKNALNAREICFNKEWKCGTR